MVCRMKLRGICAVTPMTRYCRAFRAGTAALDGGAPSFIPQQDGSRPCVARRQRDAAHLPRQWRKLIINDDVCWQSESARRNLAATSDRRMAMAAALARHRH